MPIYMRWGWDAVTGSVSADGYKSWIEVASIKLADQNLTEYTRKKPKVALVFFRMAAGRERPTQRVTIVVVKPNSNEETLHLELADVVVTGANMDGQSVAVTLMFLSSISVRRPNPVHAPTGWDIFP
jgi:hypothetical protein